MGDGGHSGHSGHSGGSGYSVVTGAASGIGRAVALLLAGEGRRLAVTDRNAGELVSMCEVLRTTSPDAVTDSTVLDITDHGAVDRWASRLVADHGAPDEVFHVAGIAVWGDPRTLPDEKWRRVIDVNLLGTVNVVEALVPAMAEAPGRRDLCCVSSAAGFLGLPWHTAYAASKGGVLGMCEVLRFDLAPHDVAVHCAVPGAVDTPLVHTIDIDGVDTAAPRVAKAKGLFRGIAVTPEQAARKIVRGVRKGRYLIYTSADIRIGRWAQVNMPWAYRAVMRLLNRGLRWAAKG